MKRDVIFNFLLEVLEKKIPDKAKLTETLMDILFMEKGAVNRRLRGEVPFSFYEVVNIAEKLNLSLDNLITLKSEWIDSFVVDLAGFDANIWKDYLAFVRLAKEDPNSEFTDSTNLLPTTIYYKFGLLYKFAIFKYHYLLTRTEIRKPFRDIRIPENLSWISDSYYKESKYFAKTTYICDHAMIDNLITDINYFSGINLISADDILQIKDELFALLDYFEKIALDGCFEESGKPVDIYISDINLDANYCYIQIHDKYLSVIRTFYINAIMARDRHSFDKIKSWVQSLIKTSTLISRSAAVHRAEFFDTQRKLVSSIHAGNPF